MKSDLSKVLITGAGGMVGSYVNFGIKLDHNQLDITDQKSLFEVVRKHRPESILHLAAATDMKRCENEPDYAYRVNSLGTYYLALAAREINAKMLYVSTNAVFDGLQSKPYTVSDVPNPQNIYGHSKYLGELAVSGILKDYAIIRTCWIFGGGKNKDKKIVGKIMEKIDQNIPELSAADDNFGSPTYGKDLISGIKELLSNDCRGIFHIVNSGVCSRAQEVSEIVKIKHAETIVKSVPMKTFGLTADRMYESLEPNPLDLRSWQEALKEYIDTEW